MSFSYFLSVAGIRLELETDRPVLPEDSFSPFLIPQCRPDVRAVFRETVCLQPLPQTELFRQGNWRICRDESGKTVRLFYENTETAEPYCTAVWEDGEKMLRVDYLSACAYRFAKMRDCFLHLDPEQVLIRHDRLWPHASCVETQFGGILFSGPSGIGKSTQAQLWCQYRGARQINGDRPVLALDNGVWRAWGAPFAGSSGVHVNDSCTVSAIVMLRQAKQCALRRLNAREAFRALWAGLALHSWDRDYLEKASSLTVELMASVPVYELSCTPDEQAVICLEEALRKELKL